MYYGFRIHMPASANSLSVCWSGPHDNVLFLDNAKGLSATTLAPAGFGAIQHVISTMSAGGLAGAAGIAADAASSFWRRCSRNWLLWRAEISSSCSPASPQFVQESNFCRRGASEQHCPTHLGPASRWSNLHSCSGLLSQELGSRGQLLLQLLGLGAAGS
ncbi:hypothetical protein DPEC_G00056420 [Dallia pectoralis]|uniref:Uncharacterized protein n=1 Tax=Dallia pectoralis TaxID=75939 RepID=A0ACC2H686_DALPE|nr:hypothetical protein DPEC_G00056420 [Dallia pectoralis]